MKTFPEEIRSNNINNFRELYFSKMVEILRDKLYIFITKLSSNEKENSYFDLEKFKIENEVTNEDMIHIVDKVRIELKLLDWNTDLRFGNTGLFIWKTEKPRQLVLWSEL
jgi:hypothetical protein